MSTAITIRAMRETAASGIIERTLGSSTFTISSKRKSGTFYGI